jgi:hypothetical protein
VNAAFGKGQWQPFDAEQPQRQEHAVGPVHMI